MTYTTRELNDRTLADFEQLASKQGECWCMFYQRATPVGRGVSSEERKRRNRRDKKALVRRGRVSRNPGIRRPDSRRLVSIRPPGRAPPDRRKADLSQSGARGPGDQFMENHVLLRRPRPPREGCRQGRAARGPRIDQEAGRRNRGGIPRRYEEDGRRTGMAMVRHAGHVPKGGLPTSRSPRHKRRPHAKEILAMTREETLRTDLGYSALRAGRSAGRSLSWHGRGRGFKSHPVHFSLGPYLPIACYRNP